MVSIQQSAQHLEQELGWLASVIDTRIRLYFGDQCEHQDVLEITPPPLAPEQSEYAQLIQVLELDFAARLALILTLTPHLRPQLLDVFFTRNQTFDRRFSEFGGISQPESSLQPTVETLAFIYAGTDLQRRFAIQALFGSKHHFAEQGILSAMKENAQQPLSQALLVMPAQTVSQLTLGQSHAPEFSADFPADLIRSSASPQDLVLHPGTATQIDEIATWIQHGDTLLYDWQMHSKLRPGVRCLFHGPPGTGKTLTACLLGQITQREVYKVDLSLVVSKFIGETTKNLARVFDQAQAKGWILFFDEADALFGKRVESQHANDHHINQEVAFLLQRIESFDGVAILASNLKNNIDDAFLRRFENIVYFPIPRSEERLRLWRQGFSAKAQLDTDVDLDMLAQKYALSGGSIMNVIRYASLRAIAEDQRPLSAADLITGIQRELSKEGKSA